MATTLRRFSHTVALIKLHVVFVTKYRHPVITVSIEDEIMEICHRIAQKNNCILEECKADLGERDHIHLLLDVAPTVSISKLVNTMKTVSSREVRKRHAEALAPYYWKPVFWKRGFSCVSAGGAPLSVLKEYIENQGKKD